ncbi:flagellar basal body rod protein FlgC [Pararhizobium sp. IMCC21322]|uniref:flagellar basal body rod protein FlgC n=1 Tax=Pararhizobium sp. IMCC21322 TaxID=3067903 RepID=UPI0027406B5F|nr:flagellar basal body rod protein FlgC [Pararhizobium sp. IMCC21322]
MDFLDSMKVAASGLRAQSGRMRIIAENIANADSTATTQGADPYRRKMPSFKTALDRETGVSVVEMGPIRQDRSEFKTRFEPGHPAANDQGYVKLPNVSTLIETVDMRQAQRSYEANLNVIQSTRTMMQRTLDILRG